MKVVPVAALLLLAIFSLASAIPAANRHRRNPVGPGVNDTLVSESPLHRQRRAAGTCEAQKELKEVVETVEENGQKKYKINIDKAVDLFETLESDLAEKQFKNTLKRLVENEKSELMEGEKRSAFFEQFEIDEVKYERLRSVSSDGARSDFGTRPDNHAPIDSGSAAVPAEAKLPNRLGLGSGQDHGPIFRDPSGREIKHNPDGSNVDESRIFGEKERPSEFRPGVEGEFGPRDPFGPGFHGPGEAPNVIHAPDMKMPELPKIELPKIEVRPEIHVDVPRPVESFHPVERPIFVRPGGRGR